MIPQRDEEIAENNWTDIIIVNIERIIGSQTY